MSIIILTVGIIVFVVLSIIIAYDFCEDERLAQEWKDKIPTRKRETPRERRARLESKYK